MGLVKRWRLKSLDSNGSFMRCLFTDISLMMRILLLCKMWVLSSKGITVTNGSLEWMATATCTVARFPTSFLDLLAFVLLLLGILETQSMQFGTVLGCSPLGRKNCPELVTTLLRRAASCSFQMAAFGRGCPQWRMAQTRKFQIPPENFSETEKVQLWRENAKSEDQWLEALKSVNDAWTMWSADCEAYLVKVGCLTSRRPERALGSPVSVVSGTHRIAAAQSADERRLRRYIRRLDEARFNLQLQGRLVPSQLKKNISRTPKTEEEQREVCNEGWGRTRDLAQARLRKLIEQEQAANLSKWKQRMHDVSQACQCLRRDCSPPMVLQDMEGRVMTSRAQCATALKTFWTSIFGTQSDTINLEAFMQFYRQDLPGPEEPPELPHLDSQKLWQTLRTHERQSSWP